MMKRMSLVLSMLVVSLAAAGCSGGAGGAGGTGGAGGAGGTGTPSQLTSKTFIAGEGSLHVTSTLILGEEEALVVDAQFIDSEAKKLVAEIKATGKRLSTIYVSHAHPDHYFGLAVLRDAFPDAKILAHPSVVSEIKSTWMAKHDFWKMTYGDDLTDTEVDPTPYDQSSLTLEGHEVRLIGPAEGDIPDVVTVFVPELKTLITADISYNGTHVWLADTKSAQWDAWVQNLESLKALKATTVIAGHRDPSPSRADPAEVLDETILYIQDFKAAVEASKTAEEVVSAMTAKHGDLKLPVVLELSAKAAFGG